MRCRGCGILLWDDPRMLAVHLQVAEKCLAAYRDETVWYAGSEIVRGTLHLDEVPNENRHGKWKICGVLRDGRLVEVYRQRTKAKANQWIEVLTRKGVVR